MPQDNATARPLILATVKENVSLTAIDPATGDIIAAVEVGERGTAKPHEVTVSADGARDGGGRAAGGRVARIRGLDARGSGAGAVPAHGEQPVHHHDGELSVAARRV